jgi:hypothetical protein
VEASTICSPIVPEVYESRLDFPVNEGLIHFGVILNAPIGTPISTNGAKRTAEGHT